ncbi:MAG: hypothetical protein RL150_665, partial [Candidatus Parcubacteria bacterium]
DRLDGRVLTVVVIILRSRRVVARMSGSSPLSFSIAHNKTRNGLLLLFKVLTQKRPQPLSTYTSRVSIENSTIISGCGKCPSYPCGFLPCFLLLCFRFCLSFPLPFPFFFKHRLNRSNLVAQNGCSFKIQNLYRTLHLLLFLSNKFLW